MKGNLKRLIVFNLSRCLVISILSLSVLIYIIPFSIKNLISNEQIFTIKELINNYSLITNEKRFVYLIVSLLLPIAVTLVSFRYFYLNKEKTVSFRDGLKRSEIFISDFISSLILIVFPYVITLIVTLSIAELNIFPLKMIICFFLKAVVFELFIFSLTLFVTVTVRTVVIQALYILSFLFIPIVLETVLSNSVELLLNGFVMYLGTFGKLLRLYPVSLIIINNYNMSAFNIIFYFIFALILFVLSGNIYINNIPQKSKGYIRYKSLKGFYRAVFFIFFAMITVIAAKSSLLILIICSFVNLVLCELILNDSLGINKGQKWYILFIGVLVFVFCIFRFDLYSIEERPIYVDEVKNIYVGTNYYNIDNLINIADNEIVYDFENIDLREFEELDADKINRFINFHNELINKDYKDEPQVYLAYKLKNEKIIIRKYKFDYRRFLNQYKN